MLWSNLLYCFQFPTSCCLHAKLYIIRRLKLLQHSRLRLKSCSRNGMNFKGWLLVIRWTIYFDNAFNVLFHSFLAQESWVFEFWPLIVLSNNLWFFHVQLLASAHTTNTWNEEKGEGIYKIAGIFVTAFFISFVYICPLSLFDCWWIILPLLKFLICIL